MKPLRFRLLFLVGLAALLVSQPLTPTAHARTIRLFIIGNSFSQNATRYLPQLAKEGGHELIIGRAELGNCSLERHWSHVEAAEANAADPKGKPYGGKSLRELLSAGTWDIVTIQQYSLLSPDVQTYRPFAQKLHDYVKKLQPNTELILHQTWAYRSDARGFGFVDAGKQERAKNQREMWESSRAAYHTISNELGLRLIPVGDAFWKVSNDLQWGYQRDTAFDLQKAVAPALPNQTNSLHVGYWWSKEGDKLSFDANHANEAGCYLGALVWYGSLFGESPEKLTFVPPRVPQNFAAFLRQIAAQTVQDNAANAVALPLRLR
ncbi:MAG TPA: DUF4886 domain-containing protein [Abditibacteriaceae bacterium]|jgi:hypothetical protein